MRTPKGEKLTDLVLAIFRANGLLLSTGDALAAPLALTSARWQVLGAIVLAGSPLSAPRIAAAMGITRQGAQKQINHLADAGLIEPLANPANRRSPVFRLTKKGEKTYAEIDAIQAVWVNGIAAGIPAKDLATASQVLRRLLEHLEASVDGDQTG